MKRYIVSGLALALAAGSLVHADDVSKQITLNGESTEAQTAVYNGLDYVPVRALAEAYGLSVEWTGETKTVVITNGGPIYITFSIGENGYTFAKTAPMKLSGAPILENGRTFIPADAAAELLGLEITESEGVIDFDVPDEEAVTEEISEEATEEEPSAEAVGDEKEEQQDDDEVISGTGVISEISDEEILFDDSEKGEVRLTLGGEVVIYDKDGNEISAEDLEVGENAEVVYGKAMTMSIPPLNNPVSITVK